MLILGTKNHVTLEVSIKNRSNQVSLHLSRDYFLKRILKVMSTGHHVTLTKWLIRELVPNSSGGILSMLGALSFFRRVKAEARSFNDGGSKPCLCTRCLFFLCSNFFFSLWSCLISSAFPLVILTFLASMTLCTTDFQSSSKQWFFLVFQIL